eukprot:TRINITY_DN49422_c0_g1_i1.p1 TRINITY_DN49422_c0_g1~~TRINITY_DN49422_c0_g1_i1.p1  ORF type:complete len:326 (-),score=87.56 TRINITY_DN49422_c0_g1_i1:26-1003(-)
MGAVCAACADVKKNAEDRIRARLAPKGVLRADDLEVEPDDLLSDIEQDEEISEVVASSNDSEFEEEKQTFKQGLVQILETTGKNMKRGKTMAMKEAITTAKKIGVEEERITEAEEMLLQHQKQQIREATEAQVQRFLFSPEAKDMLTCAKMLKKAIDAEVSEACLKTIKDRLEDLRTNRPLEEEEVDYILDQLRLSCREFVMACLNGGRRTQWLNMEAGYKVPALLTLDAPLQSLLLRAEVDPESRSQSVQFRYLNCGFAVHDEKVRNRDAFAEMDEGEQQCALAVRFKTAERKGVWCLVEQSVEKRDRLVQAIKVLCQPYRSKS